MQRMHQSATEPPQTTIKRNAMFLLELNATTADTNNDDQRVCFLVF
jgi:hypothetical protein